MHFIESIYDLFKYLNKLSIHYKYIYIYIYIYYLLRTLTRNNKSTNICFTYCIYIGNCKRIRLIVIIYMLLYSILYSIYTDLNSILNKKRVSSSIAFTSTSIDIEVESYRRSCCSLRNVNVNEQVIMYAMYTIHA